MTEHTTLPEGVVASALESLGIEVLTEQYGGELVALCPGHLARVGKLDGNPSWSINAESGVHYCFSCGFRGNLFTLIRDMKGYNAALSFRSDFAAHHRVLMEDHDYDLPDINFSTADPVRVANFYPESWLEDYVDPPRWALTARRITLIGAKQYGIRWDAQDDSWIFPLRDPDTGRLLGFQKKSQRTRMFRNRPRTVAKSETFFGWDVVKGANKVVVVESPIDAVLLADMEVAAVAICGSRMSDSQISLLHGAGFDSVFVWLDNDPAGEKESQRLKRELTAQGVTSEFLLADTYPAVGMGKDAGDLTFEQIESVLDQAGI
jgi:DNA primase